MSCRITNYIFLSLIDSGRVDRMKDAKHEAEAIIASYRAEMEASYQNKLKSVLQSLSFLLIKKLL